MEQDAKKSTQECHEHPHTAWKNPRLSSSTHLPRTVEALNIPKMPLFLYKKVCLRSLGVKYRKHGNQPTNPFRCTRAISLYNLQLLQHSSFQFSTVPCLSSWVFEIVGNTERNRRLFKQPGVPLLSTVPCFFCVFKKEGDCNRQLFKQQDVPLFSTVLFFLSVGSKQWELL